VLKQLPSQPDRATVDVLVARAQGIDGLSSYPQCPLDPEILIEDDGDDDDGIVAVL
jgi:hypothetical protein